MKTINSHQEASEILGKQYLITAFIEERLGIAKHIFDGYNKNDTVLGYSWFFNFVAQHLCRALIIDLHSLFGDFNITNNPYSFYRNNNIQNEVYEVEIIKEISILLREKRKEKAIISDLRNKQIAHYDFEDKAAINITMAHVPMIADMGELAKEMIGRYGIGFIDKTNTRSFSFNQPCKVFDDLEDIIKHLTPVYNKWEFDHI